MEGFFIHHWPGQPLPVPPSWVAHFEEPESSEAECLYRDFHSPSGEVALPDELYLRELRDLDLQDTRAIWQFCEDYGHLGSVTYVPDYPLIGGGPDEYAYLAIGGKFGFVREAQALRNCVRIWDALQGGLGLSEVRGAWEGPLGLLVLDDEDLLLDDTQLAERLTQLETRVPEPLPEALLSSYLVKTLNRGLREFAVHLSIESLGRGRAAPPQPASLLSALCLQFANHVAEQARYSTCRNESCRRKFVRQLGRAKMGQHRTVGVDFCSRHCAWAQAQRELRRRKKAERSDEKGKEKP